ncbi:MAG: SDR family NAD(P)-dependent oxidoreductase [Actinobacteria bacterium]|nr:SDR family NAD(P)-dependent oxidoreductase [Actinomycetota bacterium]
MTALVTGASRGIGRAVALELASRGIPVVATMRDPAAGEDLVSSGGAIEIARLDVTDPDTIEVPDDLTILVNNAGIECDYLPVEHQPLEDWRRVFETNLFGLVEVTRRAIHVLRAAGGGVIANVTSSSLVVPMPFYGVYRASKAAVGALSETLRVELAPFGISVVEVLPGPVATDMLAASARVPEAAAFDGYAELAGHAHAGRLAIEPMTTAVDEAAVRIVDAITAAAPPMKVGADPLGQQLLDAWLDDPRALLGITRPT